MSEGITDEQRAVLVALEPAVDESTYLAGVAVAIRLRHRLSIDLDLFVTHDFDPERLEERLAPVVPALRVVGRAPGTLHAELAGIPLSILSYRYPLLQPFGVEPGIPIRMASIEDLACMKISAIAGRGAAKDFWDLHALLEHGVAGGDLTRLLDLYQTKYPVEDVGHAIRSLAYFGEADAAPLPRGLNPARWTTIKRDVTNRVKAL